MLKSLAAYICVYSFNHDDVHTTVHIPKGLSNTFRILEGKHDLRWAWSDPAICNREGQKLKNHLHTGNRRLSELHISGSRAL